MSTFDSGSHLQNATLSGGDLTVTSGSGAICAARSTTSKTTEKVVVQFSVGTRSGFTMLGIQLDSYDPAVESNIIGYESPAESIAYQANGNIEKAASAVGTADSWIAGDVVMLAIDFTGLLFWARRNTSSTWGNWNSSGTADPATGTEGISFSSIGSGTYYYAFGSNASGDAITADPTSSLGSIPSGFSAWDISGITLSPDSDVTDGNWVNESASNVNLYASLDEAAFSDSDYIRSGDNPSSDLCEIGFSNPGDSPAEPFIVSYRYKKSGTGQIDLVVDLVENTTVVETWTHTDISTSFVTADQTLGSGEFATISDFTNLRLRFTANKV